MPSTQKEWWKIDFIPFFHDRNDRIRKQKKGAVDISCGLKSWHATYTLKNLTYEKSRQKIVCPKFHSRKATKVEVRKKRDKKDKTEGDCHHLGEVCRPFQWSLPVISVKFVGHFSEVCRSFQLFLSVIQVVLWSSGSASFRIFLLFNNLI